jgi:hypothetical protein
VLLCIIFFNFYSSYNGALKWARGKFYDSAFCEVWQKIDEQKPVIALRKKMGGRRLLK